MLLVRRLWLQRSTIWVTRSSVVTVIPLPPMWPQMDPWQGAAQTASLEPIWRVARSSRKLQPLTVTNLGLLPVSQRAGSRGKQRNEKKGQATLSGLT